MTFFIQDQRMNKFVISGIWLATLLQSSALMKSVGFIIDHYLAFNIYVQFFDRVGWCPWPPFNLPYLSNILDSLSSSQTGWVSSFIYAEKALPHIWHSCFHTGQESIDQLFKIKEKFAVIKWSPHWQVRPSNFLSVYDSILKFLAIRYHCQ